MNGYAVQHAAPNDRASAWLDDARTNKTLHPLLIVAVFIVVFLAIHPFQDGNGRLARILTTLLLLQAGYSHVPYSSVESMIENSKEGYYLALRQTQGTLKADAPDCQPWLLFFMRALQQQMRTLAQEVERERSAVELSDLAVKILDYARTQGRVTTRDMVREHAQIQIRHSGQEEVARATRRRSVDLVPVALTAHSQHPFSEFVWSGSAPQSSARYEVPASRRGSRARQARCVATIWRAWRRRRPRPIHDSRRGCRKAQWV